MVALLTKWRVKLHAARKHEQTAYRLAVIYLLAKIAGLI